MKPPRLSRHDPVTLYTTQEAARLLKLHPQTLKIWRTGKGDVALPFVRIGKAIRYRQSDILEFIQSNTFTNSAEVGE